ncbi:MAG TPA: methyltransferase domain-containing protein, partial [Candidatus Omnitrophota bacterium]|nr:methyltransferase domain-containing protein [Candidatus Omnitrophota bacterium]
ALDLLAHVDADDPALVADFGCGTGNVTRLLGERWRRARVIGVDSSAEMLAEAGEGEWVRADIGTWACDRPLDVLFSNAALHWLDDHAVLFPRLMGMLAPGGTLAVQMPRNHGAPSHTCMVEAAQAGQWAGRLAGVLRPNPVAEPSFYYDVLAPLAARLDIWETEYLQVLDGDNPVVKWTMGTALKPLLDALDEPEKSAFLADYSARIAAAYPKRADGKTLFPFRRLFLVARGH